MITYDVLVSQKFGSERPHCQIYVSSKKLVDTTDISPQHFIPGHRRKVVSEITEIVFGQIRYACTDIKLDNRRCTASGLSFT